jgi:hypothetical protein
MFLVKTQNSLRCEQKKSKIKNLIIDKVKEFENLETYKLNSEFLTFICNIVENIVKKKYKINKKEIVIEVYDKIFTNITYEEKLQICKNIDFIFDNNLITKIPLFKQIFEYFKTYVKKKIIG